MDIPSGNIQKITPPPAVPPRVPVRGSYQEKIQHLNQEINQMKNSPQSKPFANVEHTRVPIVETYPGELQQAQPAKKLINNSNQAKTQ